MTEVTFTSTVKGGLPVEVTADISDYEYGADADGNRGVPARDIEITAVEFLKGGLVPEHWITKKDYIRWEDEAEGQLP